MKKDILKPILLGLVLLLPAVAGAQITFERWYGGTEEDGGRSVAQTDDGGDIIAGYTWSFGAGDIDVYLIKTDSLSDTLWTKTLGGTDFDYGHSVAQADNEGYIIAGWTYSFGAGYDDVYLIKTDADGNVKGIAENEDRAPSLSLFQNNPNPFNGSTTFKFALQDPAYVELSIYDVKGALVATVLDQKLAPGRYEIPWSATSGECSLANGIYFYRLKAGAKTFVKKMIIMR